MNRPTAPPTTNVSQHIPEILNESTEEHSYMETGIVNALPQVHGKKPPRPTTATVTGIRAR